MEVRNRQSFKSYVQDNYVEGAAMGTFPAHNEATGKTTMVFFVGNKVAPMGQKAVELYKAKKFNQIEVGECKKPGSDKWVPCLMAIADHSKKEGAETLTLEDLGL